MKILNKIRNLLNRDYRFHYIDENNWMALVYFIQSSKEDFISKLYEDTVNMTQYVSINENKKEYIKDLMQEHADFAKIILLIQNNESDEALEIFNDMLWESKRRFIRFLFNDEIYIEIK